MKRLVYIISLICALPVLAQNQQYSLEDCRKMALENNVKMQQQRVAIENAELQKKEAFVNFFPSVSASGIAFRSNEDLIQVDIPKEQITPVLGQLAPTLISMGLGDMLSTMEIPDEYSTLDKGNFAALMASWPIFAGGQILNGNRLAKLGVEVSELQLQQTEREIKLTAEQYYWQVISLEEKLNTIRSMREMLKSFESDVQIALNAGLATRNDLLQIQLQQGQVESGLVTLQSNYNICRMLLSQYMGLGLDTSITLQIDTLSPLKNINASIGSPDDVIMNSQEALSNTLELALLEQNVKAKKLQYQMAIGKRLPTVAIGGCYSYYDMMDADNTVGMVFGMVNVPITDWWGGAYAIKREKNALKTAEMDLQDVQQKLLIGIQSAESNLRDAWQQVIIAQRSIEQADENLRLQRDFYAVGTATTSELLQAQSLNQQSRDKYVDAWTQYQIRRLEYLQATGRYE
ncbi:MAG: TolC family protein [Bacteroidales bacterium]|nr:TolC family protein [Bacteroidales bacterium]